MTLYRAFRGNSTFCKITELQRKVGGGGLSGGQTRPTKPNAELKFNIASNMTYILVGEGIVHKLV